MEHGADVQQSGHTGEEMAPGLSQEPPQYPYYPK
jgi:hypothetical protein